MNQHPSFSNPFRPIRRHLAPFTFLALFALSLTACDSYDDDYGDGDDEQPVAVVTGAGAIDADVEAFRDLLGAQNADAAPQPSGRREINWDTVPDALAAPNYLPADAFRARGALLNTPGEGVQVSADADNPYGAAVGFGHVNASYSEVFHAYSESRMFSPIGSNVVDLTFVVPGTDEPAVVRGFGAVYVDVDAVENTAFEYFDAAGRSLGRFDVPAADGSLSFLGVVFEAPVVRRVRIRYGDAPLGPDDGAVDVAVMDNFIYGEPQPIQ